MLSYLKIYMHLGVVSVTVNHSSFTVIEFVKYFKERAKVCSYEEYLDLRYCMMQIISYYAVANWYALYLKKLVKRTDFRFNYLEVEYDMFPII